MTEVVAALIWNQDRFMICQRPANKARGLRSEQYQRMAVDRDQ